MEDTQIWPAKLTGFSKSLEPSADRPEAEALWLGILATCSTRVCVLTTLLLSVLWELEHWPGIILNTYYYLGARGVKASDFPESCRVLGVQLVV